MDNQVSKSAEQVADAVSEERRQLDAIETARAIGYRDGHIDGRNEARAQTASAASPVAGVSAATALLADVMHLWVDGYISKDPTSCADDSVSGDVFEKVSSFLQAQGIEVDYCGWRRVAQPSAEGDGWIADGVSLIAAERKRQVESEGWTPEHDSAHQMGEMAAAAMCYASTAIDQELHDLGDSPNAIREEWWPWDEKWWKPSDPIRNLVKAGALIAAEIDRLKRLPTPPSVQEEKGSSE